MMRRLGRSAIMACGLAALSLAPAAAAPAVPGWVAYSNSTVMGEGEPGLCVVDAVMVDPAGEDTVDFQFVGSADSGHGVVMDAAAEIGGSNSGIRPMEMLLVGMGGCTAIDIVMILRKGRETVSDCLVELNAERAASEPKVFTRIHVHYKVSGRGLTEAKVERAIKLSKEKYCSASIMLGQVAEITHDFEVIDETAPA